MKPKTLALGGGIGGILVIIAALFFGIDPSALMGLLDGSGGGVTQTESGGAPQDENAQFIAVVLAETEDVWNAQFASFGRQYKEPKLVIFDGSVSSACGLAQSAMGPFYCPGDNMVYMDLSFFRDLEVRHGAGGDFVQAYVVAHEIGHHIQNLLGILPEVNRMRQQSSKTDANRLTVRLELQADCLAGVWAHHAQRTKDILEPGDIEEALNAAAAIGDDRLQKESQGYVVPDSFTHGTSAQRVRWFKTGYSSGSMQQCDTFATDSL